MNLGDLLCVVIVSLLTILVNVKLFLWMENDVMGKYKNLCETCLRSKEEIFYSDKYKKNVTGYVCLLTFKKSIKAKEKCKKYRSNKTVSLKKWI